MLNVISYMIIGAISLFAFGGVSCNILYEIIVWNRGVCRKCKTSWTYIGNDYDEREYVCKSHKHTCRISYNFIDRKGIK